MQRLRHEEESTPYTFDRNAVSVEEREEMHVERLEARELARAELRKNLPLALAQGALSAWVMTELARLGNPAYQIDERNGWLLYAVLGGIAGLASALGKRNTAWAASGMAAGILISPTLLEWICRVGNYPLFDNPATSSLVLVAALGLGAMTWLKKLRPLPAALIGAVGYGVLDFVYNIVRHGPGPGLPVAVFVSVEHGFLVGAALAMLQSASASFLEWRTRWIDRAADWTMAFLKQSKGE